jgi:hypothetical protein
MSAKLPLSSGIEHPDETAGLFFKEETGFWRQGYNRAHHLLIESFMANQPNPKKSGVSREQRQKRIQRIIFIIISVILILSWTLTLVVNP